jgi:hypothetical protein
VYIFVVCIIREQGMKKTRFLVVEYVGNIGVYSSSGGKDNSPFSKKKG